VYHKPKPSLLGASSVCYYIVVIIVCIAFKSSVINLISIQKHCFTINLNHYVIHSKHSHSFLHLYSHSINLTPVFMLPWKPPNSLYNLFQFRRQLFGQNLRGVNVIKNFSLSMNLANYRVLILMCKHNPMLWNLSRL